tara:strand:- start:777 stop:1076 length:300 start_codon:yes stop_codon:yes gene_type:complete
MNKYTIEQLETMFAKNRANLSKTRIDQNRGLFLNRLFSLSSIAFGAGLLFMGIWALDFVPTTTIADMNPDDWTHSTLTVFVPVACGMFFICFGAIISRD